MIINTIITILMICIVVCDGIWLYKIIKQAPDSEVLTICVIIILLYSTKDVLTSYSHKDAQTANVEQVSDK